jgi:hypothetical protein
MFVTARICDEVYFLQSMGRLLKTALLVLLLMLSGVPGIALHLCAESTGSHTHACCMAHKHMFASGSTAHAETTSCCKVAPAQSVPILAVWPSTGSNDGAHAVQATSGGVFILPLPLTRTDPGTQHLVKLLKPSVHAMLCTFLI